MAGRRGGAGVKLIPLTQGKFAMVDDEDYEALNAYKWSADGHQGLWYAHRKVCTPAGKRTTLRMHRAVAPYAVVDHIDGNGLNNQRANLREGLGRNARNAVKRKTTAASAYKGVFLRRDCSTRPWRATISIGSRRRQDCRQISGHFASELEAALAYDDAAREWFGEFCVVNFPRIGERSALTGEIYMGEPALVDGEDLW